MANFKKNIVTERFISVFNYLRERGFFETNKEFAESIDYLPQSLGEVIKGRRDVTIEVIRKLVIEYPVSLNYIFTGDDTMMINDKSRWLPKWLPKWLPIDDKSTESRNLKSTSFEKKENNASLFLPNSGKTTSTNIIELPVPVGDDSEMVYVPVVDISVAAGTGFYNPDYLSEIDSIRFPKSMVKGGKTYLCVRIKGESMVPTLQDGGYLVIRLLDHSEWRDVREGHVYVVSKTDGSAYVKRLKNRLQEYGFIVCMSDNPDVTHYRNFNLVEDEINTIWHAEWYISAKMPNIHTSYYNKVSELEDKYDDVINQLQQIHREMKALSQHS